MKIKVTKPPKFGPLFSIEGANAENVAVYVAIIVVLLVIIVLSLTVGGLV